MKILKQKFFPKYKCLRIFSSSWTENCRNLLMNHQPIVKKAFFLFQRNFSGRMFLFWKKLQKFGVFYPNSGRNFQNFAENGVLTEKCQHGCHNCSLRLQRDFLGIFFRKRFKCKKFFATGAELRWVLSKIFGRFVKRASRRPDAFVEEKYMFFWRNNRLQLFFSRLEENCWTLAKYF